MAHSYVSTLTHCVFSTKERQRLINPDLKQRLLPYLGGVARANNIVALTVGGTDDHIHLLLAIPSTMGVSKAIQLIKGGSSKWIHDTFPAHRHFAWQEGYGAFSIGISQLKATVAYIENQDEHHKRRTFQQEFLAFLKKHKIEYDPRYVWG